jgi:hypothetical protein
MKIFYGALLIIVSTASSLFSYDWKPLNVSAYPIQVIMNSPGGCAGTMPHGWTMSPGQEGPTKTTPACCVKSIDVYLINSDGTKTHVANKTYPTFECGDKTYSISPLDPNNPEGSWEIAG